MSGQKYFSKETLSFLRALKANNTRDWFNENKSRYEAQVLDPALEFISSLYDPLSEIAPRFTAIPKRVGGSLMRVYRDTRFAKDKTPYKTNIGIQLRHELGRDAHAPGYYLHIEADSAFIGAGMWRPDREPLLAIRQRIAARPSAWTAAVIDPRFRRHYRLAGESLKRTPRGFDDTSPHKEDIKRKDFIAVKELDIADVLKPTFRRRFLTSIEAAEPFMKFICKSTGAPW